MESKIHTGGRDFNLMSSVFMEMMKINYLTARQSLNLGGLDGTHPAIYNDAANAMLEDGDAQGALRLLELGITRGVIDEVTKLTHAKIKRKLGY